MKNATHHSTIFVPFYLFFIAFLLKIELFSLKAQPQYTANDAVQPYLNGFLAGVNLGTALAFSDENLADLAAGNPDKKISGVGVQTLRPSLPESFLEEWGYEARLAAFQHYQKLGLIDHTLIVGFPSEAHRDPNFYCPDHQSTLFANMYLPIWDGGANGTPVNDQNYAALYFWKMVNLYKPYIKFYEIWNEPGFDYTNINGFSLPGSPGNWWDNDPNPCDYKLRAPIQHYVRLLRIAWEVIKTADPNAYVLCGGIGYPSFLDAILRNTDNPDGGKITPNFPLTGGAYFDAVGYHSYPHFDSSTREFDDVTMQFNYFRHSDGAARGISVVKNRFLPVLKKYGYDGSKYPEKVWLITEINVPRIKFPPHDMGSEELQRNFTIKAWVECARDNFAAMHIYSLAEEKTEEKATFEFDAMGLYQKLNIHNGIFQQKNEAAVALKTVTDILGGKKFNLQKTQALNLPSKVGGAAFSDPQLGSTTYVLWAKTTIDQTEIAAANYNFATAGLALPLLRRNWDYAQTGHSEMWDNFETIDLDATPVFFDEMPFSVSATSGCAPLTIDLEVFPYTAVVKHAWTFKNGTPAQSSAHQLSVVFDQPGNHEIIFQFKDLPAGKVVFEKKINIRVEEKPTAKFLIDSSSAGSYYRFINLSSASTQYFEWNFGDGKGSILPNPDHVFNSDGTFLVQLLAENQCGDDVFSIPLQIDAANLPTPTTTALQTVLPFERPFRAGTIFKSPAGWTDEQLAEIAAGNLLKNEKGAAARAGRFLLPQNFLEYWGYDVRKNTFQHYQNLNLDDNIAVLGFPSELVRETWRFCPTEQSVIFKNIYTDIWDGGANGTPVNENNPYAMYVWKTVQQYRDHVEFWMVYDAPDFDLTGKYGWLPRGEPENWWDYNPEPCVISLRAPIQQYIRLLRITYEIVKTLDPDAYVLVGGIGYPSFLDALLRNTDNPSEVSPGATTSQFPRGGGAYFDALGFNSYPFVDGSTSYFDQNLGQIVWQRHSDAAAEGIFQTQEKFNAVLEKYGFNGIKYPRKKWLVTEANTPRKIFGDFFGGEVEQRNYLVKAMVEAMANGFVQFNVQSLAEAQTLQLANQPDDLMGLYEKLDHQPFGSQKLTPAGEAFRTASQILFNTVFDSNRTAILDLPPSLGGYAFRDAAGKYIYVLWAKTWDDRSEQVQANFSFPSQLNINNLYKKDWNWSTTGQQSSISSQNIQLTATPIFLTETEQLNAVPLAAFESQNNVGCSPLTVQFFNKSQNASQIEWFFENGTPPTSNAQNPVVVFNKIGKHSVRLTASNAFAIHTNLQTAGVEILPPPTAAFSFEVQNQIVKLKNLSQKIDSLKWILHDGTVVYSWEFERTYFDNGNFPVTLIVFAKCGSDTLTQTISVKAPPIANFNIVLPSGCNQLYAAFQNYSSSSPDSIFWYLPGANPSFSTEPNVWVTFQNFGNYTATLIVKNAFGIDTLVKNFTLKNAAYGQINPKICENETYELGGQVFNQHQLSGEVIFTGAASGGCDSIVQVQLQIFKTSTTNLLDTIRVGETVNFCGQTLSVPGIFECNLKNVAGCDSLVTLHLTLLVGSHDIPNSHDWHVFPNPFSEKLTICWQQMKAAPVHLQLFNSLGQIIWQLPENQFFGEGKQQIEINLPHLSAGFYLIKMNGEWRKLTRG